MSRFIPYELGRSTSAALEAKVLWVVQKGLGNYAAISKEWRKAGFPGRGSSRGPNR